MRTMHYIFMEQGSTDPPGGGGGGGGHILKSYFLVPCQLCMLGSLSKLFKLPGIDFSKTIVCAGAIVCSMR